MRGVACADGTAGRETVEYRITFAAFQQRRRTVESSSHALCHNSRGVTKVRRALLRTARSKAGTEAVHCTVHVYTCMHVRMCAPAASHISHEFVECVRWLGVALCALCLCATVCHKASCPTHTHTHSVSQSVSRSLSHSLSVPSVHLRVSGLHRTRQFSTTHVLCIRLSFNFIHFCSLITATLYFVSVQYFLRTFL